MSTTDTIAGQVDGHDPLYQRGFADGRRAINADLLAALEAFVIAYESFSAMAEDADRTTLDEAHDAASAAIVRAKVKLT